MYFLAQHLPREAAEGKMCCRRNSLHRNFSHKHVFLDSVQLPQDTHDVNYKEQTRNVALRNSASFFVLQFWDSSANKN